jgi:hypothetical protein
MLALSEGGPSLHTRPATSLRMTVLRHPPKAVAALQKKGRPKAAFPIQWRTAYGMVMIRYVEIGVPPRVGVVT